MSYYVKYQEVPTEFLQKILSKPNDEEFHYKLLEDFYGANELENNYPSKKVPTYRRLFMGNVLLGLNEEEVACFKKTESFYALLKKYMVQNNLQKEIQISNGGPIESYLPPKQLQETWYAIKKLMKDFPEYIVEMILNDQEIFSEFPSTWEDVVKFYYSCAIHKSAAIKIVG